MVVYLCSGQNFLIVANRSTVFQGSLKYELFAIYLGKLLERCFLVHFFQTEPERTKSVAFQRCLYLSFSEIWKWVIVKSDFTLQIITPYDITRTCNACSATILVSDACAHCSLNHNFYFSKVSPKATELENSISQQCWGVKLPSFDLVSVLNKLSIFAVKNATQSQANGHAPILLNSNRRKFLIFSNFRLF